MDIQLFSFVTLGVLAVILSGFLITRRWPVSAAMLLITIFTLLAGMYGLMDAHFSAVVQLIVYAGAIMVVFVFVIMLLNLPPEETRYGGITIAEGGLTLLGLSAVVLLGSHIGRNGVVSLASQLSLGRRPFFTSSENVKNVSALMFTDYLWAFEMLSILILAATIGAVVISKKRGSHAQSA